MPQFPTIGIAAEGELSVTEHQLLILLMLFFFFKIHVTEFEVKNFLLRAD
jgi:hypothetical protein